MVIQLRDPKTGKLGKPIRGPVGRTYTQTADDYIKELKTGTKTTTETPPQETYSVTVGKTTIPVSKGFAEKVESIDWPKEQSKELERKGFGGFSVPYSTEAGEGRDYMRYEVVTQVKDQDTVQASQLQKAGVGARVQEFGRKIFYPKEEPITAKIGDETYIVRDTRKGTLFDPTTGPLRDRPQLAANIRMAGIDDSWGERALRGFGASLAESPERFIGKLAGGYVGGQVVGRVLGFGVTKTAGLAAQKYGVATGIKSALATKTGVAVAGGLATTAYLVTATPEQVGASIPKIAGFATGYTAGFGVTAKPAVAFKGSTLDYAGIRRIPGTMTGPRTQVFRTGQDIAVTASTSRQGVFEVFGKPTLAPVYGQTSFAGTTVATIRGYPRYAGPFLSQRSATLTVGKSPFTLSQTVRGRGILDYGTGRAFFTSPESGVTGVGVITGSRPLTKGYTAQTSAFGYRSGEGLKGITYQQLVSPDVRTEFPTITGASIVRGGQTQLALSTKGTGRETQFLAIGFQEGPRTISPYSMNALLTAAGFSTPGIPKTAVNSPRSTPLFLEPTGGLISSIQLFRSPTVSRTPSFSTTAGLQGVPTIEPGFGVPELTIPDQRSLLLVGIGSGGGGGGGSRGRTVLDVFTAQSMVRSPALDVGITPGLIQGTESRVTTVQGTDTRLRTADFVGGLTPFFGPAPAVTPPPPIIPGAVPPIPLFGLAPPTGSRGGGGRSFMYTPSLVSVFEDISGPEIIPFTGLEVRPKKRKRKKKR